MNHFLPITVIAAIAIFLVKETVEAVRRYRAEARKLEALKTLLATEIEQNHWALKSIRRSISEINSSLEFGFNLSIVKSETGKIFFRQDIEGESHSQRPIPKIHFDIINKNLLDIATIDKNFFEITSEAYDGLKELDHVRESFINYVSEKDPHLEAFSQYGLREIELSYASMAKLYFECTKTELLKHKLR